MSVNVKNGTPLHGPALCETCTHAHVERGYRESEETIVCRYTYPDHRVHFRVRECSDYTEIKRMTLARMEEIAWILSPRGPKRQAGFIPLNELRNADDEIELTLNENR
ncbi:MAG TPA: hypothetical protein VMM16_07525 [Verrucomicrobiae bacterium]|nr:hypothetical protein [Verrucomicrobiae bacterium]